MYYYVQLAYRMLQLLHSAHSAECRYTQDVTEVAIRVPSGRGDHHTTIRNFLILCPYNLCIRVERMTNFSWTPLCKNKILATCLEIVDKCCNFYFYYQLYTLYIFNNNHIIGNRYIN